MSTTNSNALVGTIAAAVIQHMASHKHPTPQASKQTIAQQITDLLMRTAVGANVKEQSLLRSASDLSSASSDGTPLSRSSSSCSTCSSGTPLSRSSSSFSTCSSASTTCQTPSSQIRRRKRSARTLNFADVERTMHKKKKRKRRGTPQQRADTMVVTQPIMRALDDPWLSQQHSPLFQRQFKRVPNPDGTHSLKKHKTIVMAKFKSLVRSVLRRLLSRSTANDPTVNVQNLYERYFTTALRIVKKRRANHVQSWRLYNHCCPLVYGESSMTLSQQTEGGDGAASQQQNDNDGDADDESQQQNDADEESQQQNDADAGQSHQQNDAGAGQSQQQNDSNEESQQQTRGTDEDGADNYGYDPYASSSGEDIIFGKDSEDDRDEDRFLCPTCKRTFPSADGYPKDDTTWGKKGSDEKKCKKCWKRYMIENVLPHIQDKDTREKAMAEMRGEKTKSKRKSRDKCKWCGGTDHKTRGSKKCPHNKKNVAAAGATPRLEPLPPPSKRVWHPPRYEFPCRAGVPFPTTTTKTLTTTTTTTSDETAPSSGSTQTASPSSGSTPSAAPSSGSTQPAAPSSDSTPPASPQFQVGDNVCAKWGSRQWFLSHVYAICDDGCYRVYCPVSGKTKKVRSDCVRELSDHARRNNPTRSDMVTNNYVFTYEGDKDIAAGTRWRVRRTINDKNEFVCVRVEEGPGINITNFAVKYVMNCYNEQVQLTPFEQRTSVGSRLRRRRNP